MPEPKRRRIKWRPGLRALHRDIGYLAVGLTLVYAVSGIAVNHIADWDPNFLAIEREFVVSESLPDDPQAAAVVVLREASIEETPLDVYDLEGQLEITVDQTTLFVDRSTGKVREMGQRDRIPLRVMNWLHLNRGKKAWTYFADAYAAGLIILALTGMAMVPGKKGIARRGGILVAIGVLLPLGYLVYFGGPS